MQMPLLNTIMLYNLVNLYKIIFVTLVKLYEFFIILVELYEMIFYFINFNHYKYIWVNA